MISTRRRMRSRTSRFLGALIGALMFLVYVATNGGMGSDPSSNANIILLAIGVVIMGSLGAWLFPWIQNRFSAHQMRKKALREAQASISKSRSSKTARSGASRSKKP